MGLRWIQDSSSYSAANFKAVDLTLDNKRPDIMAQALIGRMIIRNKVDIYFPRPCTEQAYQMMDSLVSKAEVGMN